MMRKHFWAVLIGVWAAVHLGSGLTQPREAIEEVIEHYPRSTDQQQSREEVADHRLAAGAARKVGDRWETERELRVAGELQHVTMQLPEGHGPERAFNFYHDQLEQLDARPIYLCRERDCGSSNTWANDVFGQQQLYGLDQAQYYGLFEIADADERLHYVAVYTVRRGNRRAYAHVEWLETQRSSGQATAPAPNAIVEALQERGYYRLSGLALEDGALSVDEEHLEALTEALRGNRLLSLRLVGHAYQGGSLEDELQRSRDYANDLRNTLAEQGIDEDRLEAHGVGSLAPTRRASAEVDFRIELLPRD